MITKCVYPIISKNDLNTNDLTMESAEDLLNEKILNQAREGSEDGGGMLRRTCGAFCDWCSLKYHERADTFRQIFWASERIFTGLHYGIEFCPPIATLLVVLAVYLLVFPGEYIIYC